MTTPTPRAQLKSLLAQLANIPPAYCVWNREPEPTFGPPAASTGFRHGWMRVSASKRSWVGWDDLRRTDNGDGTFTMNSVGRRQITLGIDYFSLDRAMVGQPGNGGTFITMADDVLEDVRVKLWHPSALDTLNGMGLVFENVGNVLPLSYLVDDTELDAAHLDVIVALATSDAATYTLGQGWIREVSGTGTLTNANGTIVTVPFDIGTLPGGAVGATFGDSYGPSGSLFGDSYSGVAPVFGSTS